MLALIAANNDESPQKRIANKRVKRLQLRKSGTQISAVLFIFLIITASFALTQELLTDISTGIYQVRWRSSGLCLL